ncbi:MAG: PKD repeat protein [Planctomycetota bacterium]
MYSYLAAGTFDVSLTTTGPGGFDGETKVGYITVTEPPPIAEFSSDVTQGLTPLDVQFTDATTGSVTAWAWDFGDGNTSTAQSPSHSYTLAGTFTVGLTSTGPGGSDGETKVDYILTVDTPPTADFTSDVTSGVAPLDVQFTDASVGHVSSWAWDFGDALASTVQAPLHTFTAAGTYTVALTVAGAGGMDTVTKVGFIIVSEPAPVAEFGADVTSGDAPLDVQFTDFSSGVVNAWSWDLGDGNSSSQESPFHNFGVPGTYTVALTATGPGGADVETKVDYILATTPPAPVADFSADVTVGSVPLSVQFSDLTTGQVDTWGWDFGDGGSSTLANPTYIFATIGTYTVTLSSTGLGGSDIETKVAYIMVTLGPGGSGGGGLPNIGGAAGTVVDQSETTARMTRRNGTGVNALVLNALAAPVLGEDLTFTLGLEPSEVAAVALFVSDRSLAPQNLPTGELLIDPGGGLLWVASGLTLGGNLHLTQRLPNDLSLVGLEAFAQARLVEPGGVRWSNAVDLVLGH